MLSSQSDDPVSFYFLALWLNKHSQDPLVPEISRVIIGRAYYAAFLAARDLSNEEGAGAMIHGQVIEYYRRKDRYVSNKLADLKKQREMADYVLTKPVTLMDVKASLTGCRSVLNKLGLLDGGGFPEGYKPLVAYS